MVLQLPEGTGESQNTGIIDFLTSALLIQISLKVCSLNVHNLSLDVGKITRLCQAGGPPLKQP
jgi:hypothetical protein